MKTESHLNPLQFCLDITNLDFCGQFKGCNSGVPGYLCWRRYYVFKVILYSYLILKKMNERITDS